jgi:Flp pilus assembly protein TadG
MLVKTKSRRGAALVEFAVTLPVLLFLIGIAVDYSRVFYQTVTMNYSVRNGALYEFDPLNATQSRYTSYSNAAAADATNLPTAPSFSKTTTSPGDGTTRIKVNAALDFNLISGWGGLTKSRTTRRNLQINQAQLVPDEPAP